MPRYKYTVNTESMEGMQSWDLGGIDLRTHRNVAKRHAFVTEAPISPLSPTVKARLHSRSSGEHALL